ncbi:MAG: deoxyuridine 5'-triphosphate nucleotidohydrolase [Dehalococcoidales bacterium]|nr:deoxyuridine 5'-triphosphate nucleotidohydrolase [Dehalococcoidales bacterium]
MGALSGREIRRLVMTQSPPLVEGWLDLEAQLQPNGFDLTLREVGTLRGAGRLGVSNGDRVIPPVEPLQFGADGYLDLERGIYLITYNEVVHLPKHVMALGRTRSSLLRSGVSIGTAVWDAGYEGRSQSLLIVHNPAGFRIQRHARVMQLVFFYLTDESEGYRGIYQGENI